MPLDQYKEQSERHRSSGHTELVERLSGRRRAEVEGDVGGADGTPADHVADLSDNTTMTCGVVCRHEARNRGMRVRQSPLQVVLNAQRSAGARDTRADVLVPPFFAGPSGGYRHPPPPGRPGACA